LDPILNIINISKDFVFHHQEGTRIKVLEDFSMEFFPGRATVLTGSSGSGKSTLLKMIYAGYRIPKGKILVRHQQEMVDMAKALPSLIYEVRRHTIGYVGRVLKVLPRVSALETVIEPLLARRMEVRKAEQRGRQILDRLRIPENLWHLSATTFSGGDQQRINLARGFAAPYPILLLDEPTASLDSGTRDIVMDLIQEAIQAGTCVIAVFHDPPARKEITDRTIDLSRTA